MKKTRRSSFRKPKELIILICEGAKTEINYFQGLFDHNFQNREKYPLKIYQPNDYSPLGIVNQCVEEIQAAKRNKEAIGDISIWAVFDKDLHKNLPEAFQKAYSNNVKVIFSSICFEYWILLHYIKTTRPFINCDELVNFIKQRYDPSYLKRDDHFINLMDKIENAIQNNEWLVAQIKRANPSTQIYDLNPYTNVYEIVNYLLHLT